MLVVRLEQQTTRERFSFQNNWKNMRLNLAEAASITQFGYRSVIWNPDESIICKKSFLFCFFTTSVSWPLLKDNFQEGSRRLLTSPISLINLLYFTQLDASFESSGTPLRAVCRTPGNGLSTGIFPFVFENASSENWNRCYSVFVSP